MRIAADRAVVMVTRDGVEGPPSLGDAPKAATRGLRSCEPGHSRGRGLAERDGDWAPLACSQER